MDRNSKLSNVTQAYLKAFYKVLNTMIRWMTSVPLLCSISAQTKSISNIQAIQCKCRILTNTDFERSEYMKKFEKTTQCEGIKQLKNQLNHLDHC